MLVALPRTLAARACVLRPSLLLGSGTMIASCVSIAALAISASAVVEEAEVTKVGLQPRETSHYRDGDVKLNGLDNGEVEPNLSALSFANTRTPLAPVPCCTQPRPT